MCFVPILCPPKWISMSSPNFSYKQFAKFREQTAVAADLELIPRHPLLYLQQSHNLRLREVRVNAQATKIIFGKLAQIDFLFARFQPDFAVWTDFEVVAVIWLLLPLFLHFPWDFVAVFICKEGGKLELNTRKDGNHYHNRKSEPKWRSHQLHYYHF